MKVHLLLAAGLCSSSVLFPLTVHADASSPLPATAASASICHPERLRCEYLINPLGLDVPHPRLSWIVTSSSPTPRGITQVSYQVLVASTPGLLARDQGDLWDSGIVNSSDTTHIEYSGKPPASRQVCYWKVRMTDSLGQISSWSEIAHWEMGLLQPDDWQAKWLEAGPIGPDKPTPTLVIVNGTYESVDGAGSKDVTGLLKGMVKNNTLEVTANNTTLGGDPAFLHAKQLHITYTVDGQEKEATLNENGSLALPDGGKPIPYLRKDFALKPAIAQARLYATALGIYTFYLNGQRVGDHLLAPDWTDYSKRVRYQAYDVTALLRAGANTLGGMAGNGWYCGHIGNGGFHAWGTTPALMAQLEVTYTDGSVDRITTDASWREHPGPILSSDIMLGENYDAQKEIPGWDQPGLDTGTWTSVTVRNEAARPLDAQVDPPVRETGELAPKSITEPQPGHYVFDFGQNMVGFARIKVTAPAGTDVKLRHAEMLNTDGTLYTANLRGATSIDHYICKGGGLETWQPHFTFHGFRYLEITGLPQKPDADSVRGIVVGTDIPRTGEFSCSDPNINQLQSNIQWGMRGNYLSVPTDCPQRDERMGWMGDAEVFIRTAAYNGDIAAFFTKWLVDVDDAQRPAGWFTDVAPMPPNGNGTYGVGGVPAWGDAGVICPWTIYLMYGDTRILRQHLPAMTRWVEFCRANSTALVRDKNRGHDYGDWLSQGESTQHDLIATAYFAYSTSLVSQSYAAIGDQANADKYGQLFTQIKQAFNQRYVQPDGHIQGNTQAAYAMALRFNLLPDELRPKAAQLLAENVASHHDHLTTGFVGVSYLLPALSSEGQIETAYHLLLQDTFPSWLFSVKHGATTIWERWDGWTPEKGFQNPGMNSFNHYSLGSCGEWMFDSVAGIDVDPAHPGFSRFIIRPHPGPGLTQAKATFDSIHGKITAEWTCTPGLFSLHAVVPVNTTAVVHLPTTNASSAGEGGQPMSAHPEIKPVSGAAGDTEFLVGSGDYHFTCALP